MPEMTPSPETQAKQQHIADALANAGLTITAMGEWRIEAAPGYSWRALIVIVSNDASFSVATPGPTYWQRKQTIEEAIAGLNLGAYNLCLTYIYDDEWLAKGLVKHQTPVWRIEIYEGPIDPEG